MKVKKVSERELEELTGSGMGYFGASTRIYHVPEKGVYVCGATSHKGTGEGAMFRTGLR